VAKKDGTQDLSDLLYQYGVDLRSRILYLDGNDSEGEVDRSMVLQAIKGLSILAQSPEPLHIILNTPGGDTDQGFALYDYIKQLPNEVSITVLGNAHSMGVYILQAADIRRITKHSTILLHDGENRFGGHNRRTVHAWYEMTKTWDSWADEIILEALREKDPTFSKQKLQSWLSSDKIFTAEQALEVGLVDEIVEDAK